MQVFVERYIGWQISLLNKYIEFNKTLYATKRLINSYQVFFYTKRVT